MAGRATRARAAARAATAISYSPAACDARRRIHSRVASSAARWALSCQGLWRPSGPGSATGHRNSAAGPADRGVEPDRLGLVAEFGPQRRRQEIGLALLLELDQRGVEPVARIGVDADELLRPGLADRHPHDHLLDRDQLGAGVEPQGGGVERVGCASRSASPCKEGKGSSAVAGRSLVARVIGRPPRWRGGPCRHWRASGSSGMSVAQARRPGMPLAGEPGAQILGRIRRRLPILTLASSPAPQRLIELGAAQARHPGGLATETATRSGAADMGRRCAAWNGSDRGTPLASAPDLGRPGRTKKPARNRTISCFVAGSL